MRSQDDFVAQSRHAWNELDALLLGGKEMHKHAPQQISRMAALYRTVCSDLMTARQSYTPDLVAYLDGLAGRAHNTLYGTRPYRVFTLLDFIAREFPRTLRKRWRFFLISSLLFWLPFLAGLLGTLASTDFAKEILPAGQLAMMAEMYSDGFDAGRATSEDAQMAGFYVYNNVGIAFRCFATGALFGLGSIFFLTYNGLHIGTVFGYVIVSGGGWNILTFTCGHSPFELTAIVISGGAGLQMGWALVATQGRTRIGSLRAQAREIGALVVGAAFMLGVAALIEGFWSPSSAPPPVKWSVAAVLTVVVAAWLILGGRTPKDERDASAKARSPEAAPDSTLAGMSIAGLEIERG